MDDLVGNLRRSWYHCRIWFYHWHGGYITERAIQCITEMRIGYRSKWHHMVGMRANMVKFSQFPQETTVNLVKTDIAGKYPRDSLHTFSGALKPCAVCSDLNCFVGTNCSKFGMENDYCSVKNQINVSVTFVIISLTHWGRMTHICVGKLTIIGSDNGLSPGRLMYGTGTCIWDMCPERLNTPNNRVYQRNIRPPIAKIHIKRKVVLWIYTKKIFYNHIFRGTFHPMIASDSDITTFADRFPSLQVNPLSSWVPATGALYEIHLYIICIICM